MPIPEDHKLMRRVAGYHNIRLDGIGDLLLRARGASVMDIGCNRGQVGYDFAMNGAARVDGCDNYEPGILAAREWFIDLRSVKSQFEVVDLCLGPAALSLFGDRQYDITVMLATYHKIKRVMAAEMLTSLMIEIGKRTQGLFGWRGTSDKVEENEQEIVNLDRDLGGVGLQRVHTSTLSLSLGVAAIWARR